ncbi:hypothetical protein DM01DRAFT_315772 [Hesseltinella vesiculosa]|uniref:HAUS augmin-like complex subunit 6 N-terminal domain-containing protein n=1 Tax=Hesseltinella vesiculosa TaxID=101127 RepID=A0A1X2G2H8_9FUNG|nr:hypothetical protein DM01DRAFT_315772 [Hesseltinella vesiculosa]
MAKATVYQHSALSQVFFDNLNLLGFDRRLHAYDDIFKDLVLDEHLFSHPKVAADAPDAQQQANETIANNRLAFECTSHFLFTRLEPLRASQMFSSCWPFQYHRTDSLAYRKKARYWLQALDPCLIGPQHMVAQCDFVRCHGDMFLLMMVSFSTYVLQTILDRDLADPRGKPIRLTQQADVASVSQATLTTAILELSKFTHQKKVDLTSFVHQTEKRAGLLKRRLDTHQGIETQQPAEVTDDSWLDSMREDMLLLRDRQHDMYRRYRQAYAGASPYQKEEQPRSRLEKPKPTKIYAPELLILPSLLTDSDTNQQIETIKAYIRDQVRRKKPAASVT